MRAITNVTIYALDTGNINSLAPASMIAAFVVSVDKPFVTFLQPAQE
jgi:hypothetical protein